MFTFTDSQNDHEFHTWHKGVISLAGLLWLILSLSSCTSSRTEYVVDFTHGNDSTAKGSHEHPCQTEMHCHTLAERDGVQSYWLIYQ